MTDRIQSPVMPELVKDGCAARLAGGELSRWLETAAFVVVEPRRHGNTTKTPQSAPPKPDFDADILVPDR
jgi:hypothetical protein